MRHVYSFEDAHLTRRSVVTIGAFDGVHRGHQLLIGEAVRYAQSNDLVPVVLTFFPHPEMVLRGPEKGFLLTMPEAKARLLGDLGVELILTHPFNDEVRHMRAADFVDRLVRYLKMQALWVGADFAMGYRREGDIAFLRAQGEQHGFSVRVIDLMDAGGERVSSSRIRAALAEGDVAEAARLMGRLYQLPGQVVEGAKRGRTIGIPTANLDIPEEQTVPARGVYAAWALIDQKRIPSVVNIGIRPTFDSTGKHTVEAHLIDFSGVLYGKTISLEFVERLREEKKFEGIEPLVAQIQEDIDRARNLFGEVRE